MSALRVRVSIDSETPSEISPQMDAAFFFDTMNIRYNYIYSPNSLTPNIYKVSYLLSGSFTIRM